MKHMFAVGCGRKALSELKKLPMSHRKKFRALEGFDEGTGSPNSRTVPLEALERAAKQPRVKNQGAGVEDAIAELPHLTRMPLLVTAGVKQASRRWMMLPTLAD